jgi:cyclase
MGRPRVIPCLLLSGRRLVKTVQFAAPKYLGDPVNTLRIFNEKEVDELLLLDIEASKQKRGPNYELMAELVSECFMPLAYGGGIASIDQVERLLAIGVEKVAVNSAFFSAPALIGEVARRFGSQCMVVSIDVKKTLLGKLQTFSHSGHKAEPRDPVEAARRAESLGAGEIFLNAVDRDGSMQGYDVALIERVAAAVQIPVIACGSAGATADFQAAIRAGASAVAAGSRFVFQGPHRAVLISYLSPQELRSLHE